MPNLDEEIVCRFAATAVVVDSAVPGVADREHRLVVAGRGPPAGPAASSPEWHRADSHRSRQHPDRHRSRPSRRYCCPVPGMSLASLMIPERGPKQFCSTSSWNLLRLGQ